MRMSATYSESSLKCARFALDGRQLFQQTHRSHRVGLAPQHPRIVHEGQFDAASAQIHENPASALQVYARRHRQVHQPRLFRTGNGLEANARFPLDAFGQKRAVSRFPDRAGRDRPVVLDLEIAQILAEFRERADCGIHRLGLETAGEKDLMAQPNRHPPGVKRRVFPRARELDGQESNPVRSRVDAGDPNGKAGVGAGAAIARHGGSRAIVRG